MMATRRFAEDTSVTTDKSKTEIEKLLSRYGADQFMYGTDRTSAMVGFRADARMVRVVISMPDRDAEEFRLTPTKKWERHPEEAEKAYEQACRQRWRALALVIKAKLEAVVAGISTFEEEFLAHLVLPDNTTVGDYMIPQVARAYEDGEMPKMLPGGH